MYKFFITSFYLLIISTTIVAQTQKPSIEKEINNQLNILTQAHLTSNPKLAESVYHKDLILTSQSGKLYKRKEVLLNIKNKFEFYENSDILFLHLIKGVVITNLINERKIDTFPKSKYRVTAVWIKRNKTWKIISLQSSKIINRKK